MEKIVIANWKSNKNKSEAQHWVETYSKNRLAFDGKVVVAPAFPLLETVSTTIKKTGCNVQLAVQTLSSFPAGSYTGGVSIKNLEGFSPSYAILGHSERRRYFHESDIDVAKQAELALEGGITPVICVDKEYVASQAGMLSDEVKQNCIVAYEPSAAIGSGKSEDVGTVKSVKAQIQNNFGEVPVIYGGSVTEQNIAEYLIVCDGVLVGSASLNVEQFLALLNVLS